MDGDDAYVDARSVPYCVSLMWICCYLYTARLQVRMVLGDHGMLWGLVLGDTVLVHDAACCEQPQMQNAILKRGAISQQNRC